MALTLTETEKAAIRTAIARGATRVQYGDRVIQYASLAELRSILAEAEATTDPSAATRSFATFGRD